MSIPMKDNDSFLSVNDCLIKIKRLEKKIEELNKHFEKGLVNNQNLSEINLLLKEVSLELAFLKKSHLHKEIIMTYIEELNKKIDYQINSINKRIDDNKSNKFWSKRAILDVALACWGAFLTLYVAGIIKI